jgi:glycosyltransferase involved in cell wall biosynthesis
VKTYIILDGLFTTKDGKPHSHNDTYSFFTRYLVSFSSVIIIARLFDVNDKFAKPVTGNNISFIAIRGYRGPIQLVKRIPQIIKSLIPALFDDAFYILRLPATLPNFSGMILLIFKRPFGVELVGDPSDAYSRGSLRTVFAPLFQTIFILSTRLLCWYAVGTSYVTKTTLQTKYPNKSKANQYYYTSLELPTEAISTVSSRQYLGKHPLRLIQVAAMQNYYKGHDISLKIVKGLIDSNYNVHLDLIGDGPIRGELEFETRKLGISEFVTFHGRISAGESVWNMMDNAEILIHPSRQEGLPRVIIEAMARGLPCIASMAGGTPELLDSRQLIKNADENCYIKRIKEIIETPELIHEISVRNIKVAEDYTADKVIPRRNSFYKFLVENRSI